MNRLLQLTKIHRFNQRQQAIIKSSETQGQIRTWGTTKPLVNMGSTSGEVDTRRTDGMITGQPREVEAIGVSHDPPEATRA